MILNKVKLLLGISDELQDPLLETILNLAEMSFRAYTQLGYVPDDCEHIIIEYVVERFNRIGAEGMSSKSVEGASVLFSDFDFSRYDYILNRYREHKGENEVVFL